MPVRTAKARLASSKLMTARPDDCARKRRRRAKLQSKETRLKMNKETPNYAASHLLAALAAALADANGDEELSKQLYAKTKLRFITMSDQQLWELARLTSAGKPVEQVYERYRRVIAELIATRSQWTKDLPNAATKANETN